MALGLKGVRRTVFVSKLQKCRIWKCLGNALLLPYAYHFGYGDWHVERGMPWTAV